MVVLVAISCAMDCFLSLRIKAKSIEVFGHQKCFLLSSKIVANNDRHDHGRFQAKFDPRGRQMVVMVADPLLILQISENLAGELISARAVPGSRPYYVNAALWHLRH